MKKLLLSILTVAILAGGLWAGTAAYFTDTETSSNNTFTTGTIDIAVDGENPWSRAYPYALEDMKPSQTDYIDFTVQNVGTNPVNLYKTLSNYQLSDIITSEPECTENGGIWSNNECDRPDPTTDVDNWINYDMKVELYDVDPVLNPTASPVWWENIYTDGMGHDVTVGSLEGEDMYLGMIPVGKWMKVYQSYHMVSETGNAYQGDSLVFDITLTAEQLGVHALRLENKVDVAGQSYTMWWDTTYADLTYKVKDREFGYSLSVNGMPDGTYNLVAWEGYPGWTWGGGPAVTVLANVTVSGNTAAVSGSVELDQSLTNAKVWLVGGSFVAPGSTMNLGWPLTNPLYDTGLMDYYDADL